MANGHVADDPDRLPWLTDTRRPRRTTGSTTLLFWAFLAIVLVAGVSYWLGVKSVRNPNEFADVLDPAPTVTEPLPDVTDVIVPSADPPPPAQVQAPGLPRVSPIAEPAPVPIPGVERARPPEPAAAPAVERSSPAPVTATPRKPDAAPEPRESAAPARKERVAAKRPAQLQAWPADQSAGASGRVVRVGTFYTRRQAKQGWARIVRVYPGMRRLRAVVVANPSLRTGQTFYRLQFGTTSQAHSAVLCQRMRVVGQSCVTVGLPPSGGAR